MWLTQAFGARPLRGTETLPAIVAVLILWFLLAIPWLFVAPFAGMSFDAGDKWQVYVAVWSIWLYPVTTLIAYLCRRKVPLLVLIPALDVVGALIPIN
jgi:hypothetical protein